MNIKFRNLWLNEGDFVTGTLAKLNEMKIFDSGLFLAGGFARKVAHSEFFSKMSTDDWWEHFVSDKRHDIDAFGSSTNIQKYVFLHGSSYQFWQSVGRFAIENSFIPKNVKYGPRPKIQIITAESMCYPDAETAFQNFDLINCRYAIKKSGENFVLIYDQNALDADAKKCVKIARSDAPFLGKRVHKYMTLGGCKNGFGDVRSKKLFDEWVYRVIGKQWPKIYNDMHVNAATSAIKDFAEIMRDKHASSINILSPELLTLFLGKFAICVGEHYNMTQRELVGETLSQISKNNGVQLLQ